MVDFFDRYKKWTRSVVGEKLLGVNGLIYVFEAPDFEHPQQLQLVFSLAEKVDSFKCGKDGSTLELTDNILQEKDFGELGKEIVVEISHVHPFIKFIEKTLLNVFLVFSSVEDAYIGLKLVFEEGLRLFIMNIGDEIEIYESLSSSYERNEGVKYKQL